MIGTLYYLSHRDSYGFKQFQIVVKNNSRFVINLTKMHFEPGSNNNMHEFEQYWNDVKFKFIKYILL